MAIQFEPQQEQPQQEKTYKVWDTFLYENTEPYMIFESDTFYVVLLCLTGGSRWSKAVKVSDYHRITQSEFDQLTDGYSSEFTKRDFKLILI